MNTNMHQHANHPPPNPPHTGRLLLCGDGRIARVPYATHPLPSTSFCAFIFFLFSPVTGPASWVRRDQWLLRKRGTAESWRCTRLSPPFTDDFTKSCLIEPYRFSRRRHGNAFTPRLNFSWDRRTTLASRSSVCRGRLVAADVPVSLCTAVK